MVIESINPGVGNFKGGAVKRSFGELDGYIRGREAKRRTLKILVFGIHPVEFAKVGLVDNGKSKPKALVK